MHNRMKSEKDSPLVEAFDRVKQVVVNVAQNQQHLEGQSKDLWEAWKEMASILQAVALANAELAKTARRLVDTAPQILTAEEIDTIRKDMAGSLDVFQHELEFCQMYRDKAAQAVRDANPEITEDETNIMRIKHNWKS